MSLSGQVIPHSSIEVHKIIRIEFGLLKPEEIKNMAVCKVDQIQNIDQTTGLPVSGGINDLRMGTVDKLQKCQTCECDFTNCPGHFSYIELAKPMYNVGFIETCRKILRCVCYNCSRLLVSDDDQKFKECKSIKNPKKRQNAIFKLCQTQKMCRASVEQNVSQV